MTTLVQAKRDQPPRRTSSRPSVRYKTNGASLGLQPSTTPRLIEQLEEGLPFASLKSFQVSSGLDLAALATLIGIPDRTLARRRSSGRLAPEESERLLRISNVFEKAVALFEGDAEAAVGWLTTPKKALHGHRPLQYSRTEPGARDVENLIGRLENGVFA